MGKRLNFNCLKHLRCKVCQNSPALFYNACGCFYCKDCVHDSCKCSSILTTLILNFIGLSDSIDLDKDTRTTLNAKSK